MTEVIPVSQEAVWLWRIVVLLLGVLAWLLARIWSDLRAVNITQNQNIQRHEDQWTELTAWRLEVERRMTKVEAGK